MGLYCGIDWATDHHDVAVVDRDGRVVARSRVSNDAAGFAALLTLLADAGDWNRQAQPHLFNKFLGQLHHCLHTGQLYDEHRALPPPLQLAA